MPKEKIMKASYNRKTSPKVIGGHVQRKNNYKKTARLGYVVDRVSPGRGFVHVVSKKDIHDFADIIPDWIDISEGIESVFLASENEYTDGYYRHFSQEESGCIWLCAWPKDLWIEHSDDYYQEHSWIFAILGVVSQSSVEEVETEPSIDSETNDCGNEPVEEEIDMESIEQASEKIEKLKETEIIWTCYFTPLQAKAYMLMHVFLHELGHHVDKLRSKKQNRMLGGEEFAENYAKRRFHELWDDYVIKFGLVR
jgi:hypothetical protein